MKFRSGILLTSVNIVCACVTGVAMLAGASAPMAPNTEGLIQQIKALKAVTEKVPDDKWAQLGALARQLEWDDPETPKKVLINDLLVGFRFVVKPHRHRENNLAGPSIQMEAAGGRKLILRMKQQPGGNGGYQFADYVERRKPPEKIAKPVPEH